MLVSYRRLSPQFQFSLSGVTLVYLSQWYSPRRNWDSPTPLSRQQVCPSPRNQRGGGHTAHLPAGEGLGESQFRRLEKKLSTLLLCWPPSKLFLHREFRKTLIKAFFSETNIILSVFLNCASINIWNIYLCAARVEGISERYPKDSTCNRLWNTL